MKHVLFAFVIIISMPAAAESDFDLYDFFEDAQKPYPMDCKLRYHGKRTDLPREVGMLTPMVGGSWKALPTTPVSGFGDLAVIVKDFAGYDLAIHTFKPDAEPLLIRVFDRTKGVSSEMAVNWLKRKLDGAMSIQVRLGRNSAFNVKDQEELEIKCWRHLDKSF